MESMRRGIATNATAARRNDPCVTPHSLAPSLLHRVFPAGHDIYGDRSYSFGIEIADRASFHPTPRHKEQKEKVNPRHGFTVTRYRAADTLLDGRDFRIRTVSHT